MKRAYLLPPLIPVTAILLLAAYVVISEMTSEPRFIDGRVDNAPYRAGMIMPFLSPVLYVIFGLCNATEAFVERRLGKRHLLSIPIVIVLLASCHCGLFYSLRIDGPKLLPSVIGMSVGLASILVIPMSVCRKWLRRKELVEQEFPCDAQKRA